MYWFDKKIEPSCKYCKIGKSASDKNMVLCPAKGFVSLDFSCKSFVYSPVKRVPQKVALRKDYTPEDFKL